MTINTIKFSQFIPGGDLTNGTTTVGVVAGANVQINNPWTFLPSGTTAQRPAVVPAIYGRLRFNTEEQLYEYWDTTLNIWSQVQDSTDPTEILALLASHTVNEGASLIGLQDQSGVTSKTAQDLANATIITQTNTGVLQNGQALNALATGFMASAVTTGVVSSRILTGTTNQVTIANGDGSSTPVFSLSTTLSTPGTFTISGTTVANAIINDSTMATATASNLSTSSAIKTYIDTVVGGGFEFIDLCEAATTTNFASTYANGAAGVGATLTALVNGAAGNVDGIAIALNTRVLFKNQTSALQNGVYTLTTLGDGATPAVYTRATDYDIAAEILPGTLVPIQAGTVNGGSIWLQTLTVVTVGTDPIGFIEFAQPSNTYVTLATNQSITGVKTFTAPPVITLINDASGNEMLEFIYNDNAVNYIGMTNQPTGVSPSIYAGGTDADIDLRIIASGYGLIQVISETTTPLLIRSGTGYHHFTYWNFADTAAGRTVTVPDATGVLLMTNTNVSTSGQVLTSNGTGVNPSFQSIGAFVGTPIGSMIDFAGTTVPTNYLACDGSSVSRITYASLFAAIGTTWGSDSVPMFNLPDFRHRTAIGSGGTADVIGTSVGNVGGTSTQAISISNMPAHDHPGSTSPMSTQATSTSGSATTTRAGGTTAITVASQGGGAAFNIMQPSGVVLKCIKYQ